MPQHGVGLGVPEGHPLAQGVAPGDRLHRASAAKTGYGSATTSGRVGSKSTTPNGRGMRKPPLVVAHRGSSYALAEHTLDAYLRAIEEGADALECDVRLTRDGHLVCVHDRTVDRTSSGHGVVSDFDLDDLRGFDFGSWHSPRTGTSRSGTAPRRRCSPLTGCSAWPLRPASGC